MGCGWIILRRHANSVRVNDKNNLSVSPDGDDAHDDRQGAAMERGGKLELVERHHQGPCSGGPADLDARLRVSDGPG